MKEFIFTVVFFGFICLIAMVLNGNTTEEIQKCGGSNTYCSISYLKGI